MEELATRIRPFTKSGPPRIRAMIHALDHIHRAQVPGDVVECGVWRGGNIILARTLVPDRVCWLYDTFTGMTQPSIFDGLRALNLWPRKAGGWAAVSVEDVKAGFRDWGISDEDNLRFIIGPVEQTLQRAENLPDKIALLRLDTDWHASTKVELEVLYPRLQSGGIMIIDDYGHWPGARKAVDDYFGGWKYEMNKIDYTAIWMVKP